MTTKLYLEGPSLETEAMVMHIGRDDRGTWIQTDETVFHAQGGGQPADRGEIGGLSVTHVAHAPGGGVLHYVDPESGPLPAQYDDVALSVDAEARLLHARYHTAGHLVAALAESLGSGLRAVGGHHWPGQARIELEGEPEDIDAFSSQLSNAVAAATEADWEVAIEGEPHSSRRVRVGNFEPVGCGGTHVTRLAQLGTVEIRKVKRKNGSLRVSYELAQ